MDFNLVDLAITIRTDDACQLCLVLPLLGTAFAAACRDNSCLCPEGVCNSCPLRESCPWDRVFGQNLSSDPSALKRFQKPSLPFVFTFPSLHEPVGRSSEIECRLVVIGQAIQCLDMLLEGFGDVLLPLGVHIVRVETRDYQGIVHPLGDGSGIKCPENLVILSSNDLLQHRICTTANLHIRLLSPLRLFEDGRLLKTFDFSRFAMSLLRRVSSLAYYYGSQEFTVDYKELSGQAAATICSDNHFSLRAHGDRRTSGLTGYGTFQGDFSGLVPFLNVGLYVHVGKGSAFGMGAYELPG